MGRAQVIGQNPYWVIISGKNLLMGIKCFGESGSVQPGTPKARISPVGDRSARSLDTGV